MRSEYFIPGWKMFITARLSKLGIPKSDYRFTRQFVGQLGKGGGWGVEIDNKHYAALSANRIYVVQEAPDVGL